MGGASAAAAADDLCAGGEPLRSHGAVAGGIAGAGPAAVLGVPSFAGVGVDDDGLRGGGAEFCDEGPDKLRLGAVHADGDGLRECGNRRSAISEPLAVGCVTAVRAGEGEPRRQVGPGGESFADGLRLLERGQGFKGQQVGGLRAGCRGEDRDALAVELDQGGVGAVVVAVVFGAVMEGCSVRAEGCGDEDAAGGVFGSGLAGESDGAQQGSVGPFGGESDLGIAHAGDLVAGGEDAVGSGFDVGAMDGDDLGGFVFKDVGGPERAIDVRAEVFELRREAAVEYVDAIEECGAC